MIVDLLRNDIISRIAEPSAGGALPLFHTEALPSVWQMTSDRRPVRPGTTLADVACCFLRLVTGALQGVRAMQMIR
jgi:para-aminobenzoate synthetase/4-amino-4-deoxychorismate lyase